MNRPFQVEDAQPGGTIGTSVDGREDLLAMTPHGRLSELTAILANGIHRLRAITPAPPECGQIPADSSPTGLDPGAQTCPDGAVFTTRERGD